jgi:hypothetical protein
MNEDRNAWVANNAQFASTTPTASQAAQTSHSTTTTSTTTTNNTVGTFGASSTDNLNYSPGKDGPLKILAATDPIIDGDGSDDGVGDNGKTSDGKDPLKDGSKAINNMFGARKATDKTPPKTPPATIADIIKGAKPGRETKGKTTQWIKPGGYLQALKDF